MSERFIKEWSLFLRPSPRQNVNLPHFWLNCCPYLDPISILPLPLHPNLDDVKLSHEGWQSIVSQPSEITIYFCFCKNWVFIYYHQGRPHLWTEDVRRLIQNSEISEVSLLFLQIQHLFLEYSLFLWSHRAFGGIWQRYFPSTRKTAYPHVLNSVYNLQEI